MSKEKSSGLILPFNYEKKNSILPNKSIDQLQQEMFASLDSQGFFKAEVIGGAINIVTTDSNKAIATMVFISVEKATTVCTKMNEFFKANPSMKWSAYVVETPIFNDSGVI